MPKPALKAIGLIRHTIIGQGVGLIEAERSCRQVVQDFREEFAEAVLGLTSMLE